MHLSSSLSQVKSSAVKVKLSEVIGLKWLLNCHCRFWLGQVLAWDGHQQYLLEFGLAKLQGLKLILGTAADDNLLLPVKSNDSMGFMVTWDQ